MATDKITELYDALKADGLVEKELDNFRGYMLAPGEQGYKNRRQLYEALKADNLVTSPSYEEFTKRLGLVPAAKAVEAVASQAPEGTQATAQVPAQVAAQAPEVPHAVPTQEPWRPSVQDQIQAAEAVRVGMDTFNAGSRERMERLKRSAEPLTAEGREARKAKVQEARSAGVTTKVSGLMAPVSPVPSDESVAVPADAVESQPSRSMQSPVPYGVKYVDGKPVAQWLLPDGTITTDLSEAEQAEYKARGARLRHEFEGRMKQNGLSPDKPEDMAMQAQLDMQAPMRDIVAGLWGEAEDAYKADRDQASGREWDAYAHGMGGPKARIVSASVDRHARDVTRMKHFDLQKMSDAAWERLGRDGQERVVDRLRGLYAGASDEELASMARSLSDNAVYEYAVEKNMPSSALEYFGRTVADMNVLNSISKGIARSEAGASGDMAAYEAAMEEYGKDHTVAKVGGTVVGMAADPVTVLSGGIGAMAGKGALSLGGRILAQRAGISAAGAGTRYLGTTLGGRILAGSAGSAANLAAYEGLKEGERQFMYGGHIDPETFVNEGYSPGEILKSAGHGAMMGAIIGNVAPLIGKGSNAAVKAVSSTAGKLAVRGAEQGVSAVVEGTIFSVPQWIDGKTDAWDVWTDNMAMMLGFKASHGIKSAPRVIASLRPIEPKDGRPLTQAERNHNRMDFEERLRKRLDESSDVLKFTAEEREELRRTGYGSLADLLRGDKTRERDGIQAETVAHSPEYDGYSVMEELMQDGRVSEATRAKAYYLLTGRQLPPSTIRSYRVVDGEDGRVYVQSLNADGGVVTSRRYKSREDALQETAALDRQIELNTIDVGERYKNDEVASKIVGAAYEDVAARSGGTWTAEGVRKAYEQAVRDQADPEKAAQMGQATKELVDAVEAAASKHVGEFDDMTPEAIRKRINEAYEVDVDTAIRKPQDERSESEQTAVRKYVEKLFPREGAEAAPTAGESAVREARDSGYEITDPAAREQTMRATRYQEERLRKLFKRDDVDDMLREELGTDDAAEALDRLATSRYDDGDRAAIADYLKSRESSRAVEQRMEDDARAAMDTQRVFIDKTSHEDGHVRPATMKVDDRPVYIVKGNVVLTDDGKMINTSASDGVIYVYDPAADKVEQTSPDQLAGLGAATTTVESHAEAERVIAQQLDRDLRAARGIIDTFNPGETYVADFGAGARRFTIAGMGEDGKVLLQIDGDGKLYSLSPEHLSQYIDHYRQSAFESEMQPVADEGHMVAGPGAAKAAEQKQSKTADAEAMPYEFGDSFRVGISGRGESQQAAVVDSEGETVTIWTPFPVTDKSEKSRTTSGYTTDLSRGELDKSVMRDDNGRPVDYVQANPEPETINTAEALNGEGKSISLQSDNQQEQNGNGPEQNNDERALARQTDGGRVADDTARGMEAYRDRSDIRVYEEGVAAAYNAHTEYSERDRRDAESERLVGIAKAHGQYKSREEVRALGSVNLKRTGESEVFIDDDNRRVYKIKDPYAKSPMKGDVQPEDVIYEHLVHNKYFPETRYKFEGISDDTGDVRIVLSQGYVESIGQPTEAQIEADLAEKGLTRNGKYTFSNDEISVTDVTGDNALLGADGKVYFIDPIINFKKPVAEILGGVGSEAPATEVAEARHGAPAVDGPESMPMRQVKEKGETWEEPDYLATTPARSHAYIYNESGLTRQEANEHVAHMAKSAGEAVEKHKKRAPQIGGSIARYQKEKAEWEAAGAELQRAVEFWDAVKGEQQRVVDSEKAVRDAENAREHDEAVARFEHEQRIKAEQQAEQDAVGTNAVNPKIKAKWDAALKITGNANVHVLSDGSTISGHYVLTEAGAASASHDPADGFRPTVGFPVDANGQNVNDRDYMRDADAQRMVRSMADAFDSRALQTPVIVSRDGVVLSGNNRTMSGDMAATQGTDKAYVDHLMQYGGMYGFSPEQIAGMKHPRVVFVPDVALPYDSATFARFNAQEMKSQSKPEAAVKLGKIVPDNVFGDIVGEISRYERLSDFYANETAASQALGALRAAGIVNDAQMPELRTGAALSAAGRELLENTLIGKIFQADPDAVRKIMEVPSMRQTVVMALSEIAANRSLSSRGYDIVDELSRAVDLCYRAKSAQPDVYVSGVPVSPFGRQHGLFDDEYGDSRVTDAATLLLADLLNDTKPSRLRNVLAVYNRGAGQAAGGSMDLFTGEVPSKETILSEINNHFINATPREQQALVDDAISERRQRAKSAAEQRGGDPTTEQTAAAVPSNQGGRAAGDARGDGQRTDNMAPAEVEITATLSETEKDENGKPFVTSSDGTTTFGVIDAASGLANAPIRLSLGENIKGADQQNHGYGLLHIEAGHGEQIRSAGFPSVEAFVESVARNYEIIREGNRYGDRPTYLLEVSDGHNNTLFIQLSNDGTYWNVNSAGIFREQYSRRKPVVKSLPTIGSSSNTEAAEVNHGHNEGATVTSENSSLASVGKDNTLPTEKQESTEKSSVTQQRIADAEAATDTEPTEAQKAAGNYRKGHVSIDGFDVTIENPKGSVRRGTDADGKAWETTMHNTYGYIRGTEGVDGDHIDVFLSDNPAEGDVYVVDQYRPDGSFDEHKVMYGFTSAPEAEAAYLSNYSADWAKGRKIVTTGVSKDEFKKWVESSHRKTKPFAEYKGVNPMRSDSQDNPIDANGHLIIEDVESVADMLDTDFTAPTRTIGFPELPENVDAAIGANGRKVIIKKSIFIKNRETHGELTPNDSRDILNRALYNPNIVGTSQPIRRPDYKVAIQTGDKNAVVVLDVFAGKDNVEIVGWRKVDSKGLEKMKRQAEREGGQFLILSPNEGSAAALSALPSGVSSVGKDNASALEKQVVAKKAEDVESDVREKIDDFGEEIAGARKNMLRDVAKSVDNVTVQSLIELPMSKAFKRPPLKKLVDSGVISDDDAVLAEAIMLGLVYAKKKPALTRKMSSKREVSAWAEETYNGIRMLGEILSGDVARKDAALAEYEASLAEQLKASNEHIAKMRAWNPGQHFDDLESVPDAVDVMRRILTGIGYRPGDKVELPLSRVELTPSKRSYQVSASGKQGAYWFGRYHDTLDEAIDTMILAARLAKGDMDVELPSRQFGTRGVGAPRVEFTGKYTVSWLLPGSYNVREKTFDTEEEAKAYAEKKNGRVVAEQRYIGEYERYVTAVTNPLTGNWHAIGDEFTTRAEALSWRDENSEEVNRLALEAVYNEMGSKGVARPHFYVSSSFSRGRKSMVYSVMSDDKSNPWPIIKDFATRSEAERWLEENMERLEAERKKRREAERAIVYYNTGAGRTGEDYRRGRDATPAMFDEAFGFRGVQFGNWTNDADRQAALNQAYDALMDMCGVLGLTPRSLSLDGELGLAFGARGSGSALAHYEPTEVVINLTKAHGAGVLAHEWWHAVDNFLSRRAGVPMGYASSRNGIENMHPAVVAAVNELMQVIGKSEYAARSKAKGEYWGRPTEMTARLFESWVADRLKAEGMNSPFLAPGLNLAAQRGYQDFNYGLHEAQERLLAERESRSPRVMSPEEFRNTPQSLSGYPYPTSEELAKFAPAMEQLFEALSARENASGSMVTERGRRYKKLQQTGMSLFDWADNEERRRRESVENSETARAAESANAALDEYTETYRDCVERAVSLEAELAKAKSDEAKSAALQEQLSTVEAQADDARRRLNEALRTYYVRENTPEDAERIARDMTARAQAEVHVMLRKGQILKDILEGSVRKPNSLDVVETIGRPVKTAGGNITYDAVGHLPDSRAGEFAYIERQFSRSGEFGFTGSEHIRDRGDVAYMFRSLEDYSIEHVFAVFVKDGRAKVLHLGMGGPTGSYAHMGAIRAGYDAFGADKIYFVHNHPSGALQASVPDKRLMNRLELAFGDKVATEGIIIDTTSGRYTVFSSEGVIESADRPRHGGGSAVEVMRFDKAARHGESSTPIVIKDANDVARYVAAQRLGGGAKVSYIVLSNSNEIVGNFHTEYDRLDAAGFADELASTATKFGGTKVIVYGNTDIKDAGNLGSEVSKLSLDGVTLLDVVKIDDKIMNRRSVSGQSSDELDTASVDADAAKAAELEQSTVHDDGEVEYRTPEEGIEYFNARSVQPWSERLDHLRFKRDELGESLSLSERREVRELGEQERVWEETWAAGHTDTDVPTGRRSRFDFYAAQYGQGGMVADIRDAEREVGPLRDRSGALVSANARDMARRALPVIARRRDDLLSDRPKYSRAGQAAIDAELADLEYMALYYQRMGEGEDVERTMPGRVEHQRMLATAREVAASLGEKVVLYEAPGDIHDTDVARLMRKRRSYGWYNPNDGTIHINVGRHTDSREIVRTVLHEVIGHKTIEEILGPERFARFIDEVWNHADGDVRAKIGRKMHRHGWDYREATKEYLGEIAEEINEKGYDSLDAEKKTVWQRVKAKIEDFLNRILEGLKIPARVHLSERDLSYMLWKLMRHQQRKAAGKPAEGDIFDKAEDIVRREEWQRDEAGLQIVARDGIISKRERIDKLRKSMPVKISGKEVEAAEDIKQYKKNALEYGKRLQGEYVNEDTGHLIQLQRGRRNGGLKEILQHDITDRAHIQSVAALPQIIEKGIYIESVPNMDVDKNPDVAEYQHYVCGLKIGDDDYTVHSIVAVDKRGDRYYDHKLSRIEKGKLLDFIEAKQSAEQILAPMPGTKPTIRSERKINELISLLQIDDEIDSEMRYTSSEPEYRPRQKPAPRNTIKVYKLVRIKEERPGEWFPLFIDSAAPLRLGEWLDADSPDLEMLRGRKPGQYLVNPQTKEVMTREEVYQQHPELRSMSRGHDTKYPSVDAIKYATDNGLRWMEIEETDKAQRRFDGENRRYWNLGINGSGSVSTFSMRPGWHAGSLPTMRQIGKGKNKDLRDDNFVWVEGEVSADVDYQAEAERNPDKDLPDRIPEDGFYMKATNVNKTTSQADRVGWYVAGSFKANRLISDAEARQIIDDFNAAHPDMAPVAYDYDRESGRTYDPEAGLHFRDGDDMQNMTIEERTLKLAVMLADRHSGDVAVRDAAVEALGKTLGNIRKAMGTQHTYDFNTVRSLSAVADILISSGTFQPEGRGEIKRLYGIMKRGIGHAYTDKAGVEHVAQSEKDFNEAVESLMDLFVDNQLKVSERFLADVMKIRGSKVNARGVEVMGELDVEGQIMVHGLKDYMEMDIQTIRSRIETLDEQIANGNEAASMTAAAEKMGVQLAEQYVEEVADRAAQERIMRDELRDKSAWDPAMSGAVRKAYSEHKRALRESIRKIRIERAEAMRQLASQIGNELRGSIERVKAFREREKERIEAIHHNANSDMTGRPYDEHGMKKKGIGVKLSNNMVSRLLLAPAATFEQIMRVFGSKSVDGEGYLYDRFVRGWQECRDKEWISTQEVEGILNKKAAEILGKRNARWSDLYALTRKAAGSCDWWDGGEIREHKVTQGNLMYMYMVNKMTDGQVKLRRMCITEENMQEIEQALDPRLKEVADWLQSDLLPNLRNKYNEVHMRMLGAPMAEIENYFPLKILANARLEEVEMAGKVDGKDLPKTMTGSIIKRRYNNYALDVLNSDAVSIALDHIREMETWAAFAEYRRDLCTLLSYKHFRNQVKNMSTLYGSGEKLWDKFYDLSLLVGGAYQPKTSEFDKVAVNITKLATGACIAIRLNTALKQLLSYPAFAPDANLARLMYNVTPWRARVCWKWAMKNMPSFQRRWKSRQAGNDLLRAWKFDWDWTRADFVQKVQRAGITPNAFIDALTVAMGSEAVYQSKLKGYLKDGFSKEEAHRRAIQDAEIIFNLSQQSSELPYLSLLQNDRSYLTTCITNFRNSPMSYLRQSIQSKRELANMVKGKDVQIEFETKKGVREGLTPEQAKARAERKYKRNWARDLFKSTTFDYILPALWAFGLSGMWYCIFGNDDEKKKQYAEEAMKRGMLGGLEGFTFGGTMPDFMYGLATGDKPQLDEETSPAMGLITDMANLYSNGKTERAANEMINTMIALGVGVNPQVLEDGVVAGIDFFGEDEKSARDWALLFMRVMSCPQSQMDQVYFDELGMDAREAQSKSPAELAERYATYKARRANFATMWAYDDDRWENEIKGTWRKRFETEAKKRLNGLSESDVNDRLEGYDAEWTETGKRLKRLLTEPGDTISRAERYRDLYESGPGTRRKLYEDLHPYLDKMIKSWLTAPTAEDAAKEAATIVEYKAKVVEMLDASDDREKSLKLRREAMAIALDWEKRHQPQKSGAVSQ